MPELNSNGVFPTSSITFVRPLINPSNHVGIIIQGASINVQEPEGSDTWPTL